MSIYSKQRVVIFKQRDQTIDFKRNLLTYEFKGIFEFDIVLYIVFIKIC